MKLVSVKIDNYRGLRSIEIPLSQCVCIIGENNAGKSTVLQALSLFISGSPLGKMDCFDESKDIRIAVKITDIGADDLARLAEQHREKVEGMLKNGSITLARCYGADGKSRLRYQALSPVEKRFQSEAIDSLLIGQRSGSELAERVIREFPELADSINAKSTLGLIRGFIQKLADSLPDKQKKLSDADLPTGIDKGILPMLPEPVYIQAVKNLSDDTKVRESTPFGKILGMLMRAIEGRLAVQKDMFDKLDSLLNSKELDDGTVKDERLDEVKFIESTVESYIKDSFSNVKLDIRIPPPDLKTILSSAQIFADDGVKGSIDFKGDGLKRTIVFAILRAYMDLSRNETLSADGVRAGNYLLLFEEPELYLHPKAQRILFEALAVFSKKHHAVITTHSPNFLGTGATATFIKLNKKADSRVSAKPFTVALPVDLSDMTAKNQFQLICFENNNAAFFSDTVVMVEGDSDCIIFSHIAKLINPEWDCAKTSVVFVPIGGKGSIKRYREFFKHFGVRTAVISDLDLLVKDFDKIEPSEELKEKQSTLMQTLDKVAGLEDLPESPSQGKVSDAQKSGTVHHLWQLAKLNKDEYDKGNIEWDAFKNSVEEFFAWEKHDLRLNALKSATDESAVQLKRELLAELRDQDVFVLDKGAIEEYYPEGVTGQDKPSKAQCFCDLVLTRDAALACCGKVPKKDSSCCNELELICSRIFAACDPKAVDGASKPEPLTSEQPSPPEPSDPSEREPTEPEIPQKQPRLSEPSRASKPKPTKPPTPPTTMTLDFEFQAGDNV